MVLSIQHFTNRDFQEIPDRANQLLNLLPSSELQNLLIYTERIILPAKKTIHKPYKAIEKVYFPIQGIISLLNISQEGLVAESAAVSNEGMIGLAGFLGGNTTCNWAISQTECIVLSLPINILRRELTRNGGELKRILLLYSQALLAQISQNVLCSCHHTLEQRLARWLIFYSDRLSRKELLLTQETLADLLGVRRTSLTVMAGDLRQRKLIDYSRGRILIENPAALRKVSCQCDRTILDEYTRLLNL
jgi:CRP-like cAMP-binding protein